VKRPAAGDEQEYLYLTTRGRKTGRRRRIEIWFTQRGRSYYLVAEHGLAYHLQLGEIAMLLLLQIFEMDDGAFFSHFRAC
jgi:hypothetical protein